MIELNELRQFAAFGNTGTLSGAADALHLSQPALSRSMKKLEDELGVTLFTRRKNKLELNKNGEYVLELVEELINNADTLIAKARDYDRMHRTLSLGVCAPAPMWRLAPLIANLYPHMTLQTEIVGDERLLSDLDNNVYQLVAVHEEPKDPQYYWKECEKEFLLFALPKSHRFAKRKRLSFADMDGENMLLMSDIGFWDFVHKEKMKKSRFLTQSDRFSFTELVQASSLPSFTSNLAKKHFETADNRVEIPITDKEAAVTYYLVCKAERKKEFMPVFAML